MSRLADSCWRAAAYCLHPTVIALSFLPVLLMGALAWFLALYFWVPALDAVQTTLGSWQLVKVMESWLGSAGLSNVRTMLSQLIVMVIATPVIVIGSLLLVAAMMAPWMLKLVAKRRFPTLEQLRGGSILGGVVGALWVTLLAVFALIITIPLWLIPPLVLVLPPLIWGWLTFRVMSYDVLADHASREERREIIKAHRFPLIAMGVLTGYVSALPSMIWGFGLALIWAPYVVLMAIWTYTLVFAFSALWFSHYLLSALADLRESRARDEAVGTPVNANDALGHGPE
ncbi:MAG: EI24 domain-containing protein [Burkholderiales bacterium]|nr:EI24 domain-containing protein [Burkholderiales bacterium]